MKTKRLYYLIGVLVLVLIGWMVSDTLSQPGVDDLETDFQEMAFYRNENNTGPIRRIYVVTVSNTAWNEMEKYGKLMPHTKYGNTQVYFFLDADDAPKSVDPQPPHFDQSFERYCIARFEKKAMGEESFVKYPFRR